MVTIGNDLTPGPVTTVTTEDFIGRQPDSPQNVVLVGSADLGTNAEQGTADPGVVQAVTDYGQAGEFFGTTSNLTYSVHRALGNGSEPVFAVAAATTEVQDEAIDSQSGTLSSAPLPEKPDAATFTVGGTDADTELVYDLDAAGTPPSGVAYLNPVSGEFQLSDDFDSSGTNTGTYTWNDYSAVWDAVTSREGTGNIADFVSPTQEHEALGLRAEEAVNLMEQDGNFAIALNGIGTTVDTKTDGDTTEEDLYTSPYNNSRVQLYYPTRTKEGDPIMGAIAGKRGQLSLNTSPLQKGLAGVSRMLHRLDDVERENLMEANVNPIESRTGGATIGEDLTAVADDNSDEYGMDSGFERMVMDQVTLVTIDNEDPFIGRLNNPDTRNALEGVLQTQLKRMEDSNEVIDFTLKVTPRDADSADVRIAVETPEALRNIYNKIVSGRNVGDDEAAA